jgi:hypothetical protein
MSSLNGESIILVPGLFGFTRIGGIDYFDQVAKLLSRATGIADIETLQTPPTGPLWRRVDVLHQAVRRKLREGTGRIHLVGHSTGGVDVRLLTSPRYLWPGGPSGEDRSAWFERLGAVVAMSAPQKGTPVAARLRGSLEGAVPLLFVVSILAKQAGRTRDAAGRRISIAHVLARAAGAPTSALDTTTRSLTGEIRDFVDQIIEDHPLIHELTPFAMQRLNEKLASTPGDGGREVPIVSFVTVAPPPAVLPGRPTTAVWRALYAFSYRETRLKPGAFGPFPKGDWIGDAPARLQAFEQVAQDGVVPAASQTLDGYAKGIVFADHLDVVGHYPGAEHGGETVFDSGAAFDDERMRRLWTSVGSVIAERVVQRVRG